MAERVSWKMAASVLVCMCVCVLHVNIASFSVSIQVNDRLAQLYSASNPVGFTGNKVRHFQLVRAVERVPH
jgi:predicted signal transduction protein with EAL and GGDEF domain